MIESEIAILSSVSHPHIIMLEEVFDFETEKYLIMEYVQVGGIEMFYLTNVPSINKDLSRFSTYWMF